MLADHTTRAHSEVGASIFHRYSNCPASVLASRGIEDLTTEDAMRGTAAHELSETVLKLPDDDIRIAHDFIGTEIVVGNHVFEVDETMADAVHLYCETVWEDWQDGDILLVEERFSLEQVRPGAFGTNDALRYRPSTRALIVYDFKNGVLGVDAYENGQLLYYALGAVLKHGWPVDEVELVIVQPNGMGEPVKRWTTNVVRLIEFADELGRAIDAAMDPDAPFRAGPWCKFCPKAPTCETLRAHVKRLAKIEFRSTPIELTPEELAEVYAETRIISDWVKAVKAYAVQQAKDGNTPAGMKLIKGNAKRVWKGLAADGLGFTSLGLSSADLFHPPKMKSPAQVERLVPKALRPALNELIDKTTPGVKLVPLSAKGEPIERNSAAVDFADDDD